MASTKNRRSLRIPVPVAIAEHHRRRDGFAPGEDVTSAELREYFAGAYPEIAARVEPVNRLTPDGAYETREVRLGDELTSTVLRKGAINALLYSGMALAQAAAWTGDTPATIERHYSSPRHAELPEVF